MRRLCFLLLMSLVCLPLCAVEQPSEIKGRIVEPDGSPVKYASVILVANKKNVDGAITDTVGVFLLKGLYEGKYKLKVSSIGYDDKEQIINLHKDDTLDLGEIVIKPNGVLFDGVASPDLH